jgi:nicotinate-nucleotide adenylyltransferase
VRGILGGTFDPPHVAHLVAAETAYHQLGLERVTFIPAGAPWQKADRPVSEREHRWEMTRRAIEGVAYFDADDREIRNDGWTYTAETLEQLDPAEAVVLILGADAALGLPSWHRPEFVVDRAGLAVYDRRGVTRSAVEEAVSAPITWLNAPELAVSGTGIRAMVREHRSARFLVTDSVWEYIEEQGLYRDAI